MDRYIYFRNTQKQLKITTYGRNKSFLEDYLVHNRICSKLLESLLQKLGGFASLCIKGVDFASQLSMFQVPSSQSLITFHIRQDAPHLLITLRSWQLPSVNIIKNIDIL